uniref:Gustatory receptor n=1 Tax=Anopheles atroparvus TaxID=41427 RepID=A0AAG5DDV0_ANOAO
RKSFRCSTFFIRSFLGWCAFVETQFCGHPYPGVADPGTQQSCEVSESRKSNQQEENPEFGSRGLWERVRGGLGVGLHRIERRLERSDFRVAFRCCRIYDASISIRHGNLLYSRYTIESILLMSIVVLDQLTLWKKTK